ncbi:MAG: rod shape-determining protein MreC [Oscillospiraceae bacterium]|nr:rod shape-determining protein MreC [Oscillospiraceae bacterium]
MKFFLRHKGVVLVSAAALLILGMAVFSFFSKDGTTPLSNAVNFLFRPLHILTDSALGRIDNTRAAMADYESLAAEYDNLYAYVAEMQEELRRSRQIIDENDRLRELLGLQKRDRKFEYISTAVIDRSLTDWSRTFLLSKGVEAGIKKDQCVISSSMYLVGIVSEVGSGWSRVTLVTDADMNAGAKIERTGQTAIAMGDWDLMRDGQLKLSYIDRESDVQNTDLVLTSGQGGIFPDDITIGSVTAIRDEPSGQGSFAVIEPKADLANLSQVFVIKSFVITE